MSVVIVHGTHDPEGVWWMGTLPGSFAVEVDNGLMMAGSEPQVWRIGNQHVSVFEQLRPQGSRNWLGIPKHAPFENREGRFKWSGADLHGAGRLLGGTQLARYLEVLSSLAPDDPIHVIAHSHGCNVVKQATQELQAPVNLGRIILLACPHFVDHQTGGYPYQFNPSVFGNDNTPILNFYSPQDTVQTTVAEVLTDLGMSPGLPKVDWLGFPGTPIVDSHRTDKVPNAAHLYEDFSVVFDGGEGIAAHGAVHNGEAGKFCGYWLAQSVGASASRCWSDLGLENLHA